uniref:UDP-2,3-diacylglucosamine hydrolase n=1 Tax=Candidatus Kentrum sp. MB TaxID=2138164 RepID=A0A451BCH8_9GAMM|nr:MAG: UDP-2,3-diacylglucosamine hydrolase [Candidatus Kentron sp. MB]VFK32596.1 MAG: UDP-2,3-diacylglucosamine hydrolase [Candidatus Kentron sp. MB]VFK75989.1 MAG: UDP-2,3-diacylglucosamine hydrolase [Candidatus Kentron sp. MB]
MATFFLSDVHLSQDRQEIIPFFLSFLDHIDRTDTLYILGDLFDLWLGDDDMAPPHPSVIDALRRTTERGVSIGILHGNHDFLLGKRFEKRTGCRLLPDPSVILLYGQRVLITHGDTLCTNDMDYQRYRSQVRNPLYQRLFLLLPIRQRRMKAASIRARSREAVQNKPARIMDVSEEAVERMIRARKVRYLIHGHIHRSGVHELSLRNGNATRIVLGDWYKRKHNAVLVWERDGFQLITI